VTKYFGMFGISANYTYTHSRITTTKLLYTYVAGVGNQTETVNQTRPLQGQANNIGNLSLLFKDQKIGLDAQLALLIPATGSPRSLPTPTSTSGRNPSPSSIFRWKSASPTISLSSARSTT
jgi:hypothetical protein